MRAGSLVGALLVGALLLLVTGNDPWTSTARSSTPASARPLAFSQTLVQTTPLVLTALATSSSIALRLYSIGMDGQLIIGAVGASGRRAEARRERAVAVAICPRAPPGCSAGWRGH